MKTTRDHAGLLLVVLGAGCASEHAPSPEVRDPSRSAGDDAEAEAQPPAEGSDTERGGAVPHAGAANEPGRDSAPEPISEAAPSAPSDAQPVAGAEPSPPPRSCLRSGDYAGAGSYPVTRWDVELDSLAPELATRDHKEVYTIFQPTILESDCPHPITIWGNDASVPGVEAYGGLLSQLASWGIVVMAAHTPRIDETHFAAATEFLLAQNRSPGSPFYGKLSDRVAVAGHGQGGVAASLSSGHPGVTSVVCLGDCRAPAPGAGLLCLTGTSDPASGCGAAFDGADGPAFFGAHVLAEPATPLHGSTPAGIQYHRLSTAWLRCQLHGDADACALFDVGDACSLCAEFVGWHDLRAKNL